MKSRNVISVLLCTFLLSACGTKVGETADTEITAKTEADTETLASEAETEQTSALSEADSAETTAETPDDNEEDNAQVYNNVIDGFYKIIAEPDYVVLDDGMTGVSETANAMGTEQTLDTLGYAVEDISGDGIPELLVGYNSDESEVNTVLAMFTCVDNAPQFVFEGWSRNSYHLLSDGTIFNQGSGGAMYSIFGVYDISEDGTSLNCKDYYFIYEKDDSYEEIGFYHNTTGEWDKSVSEEMDMSDDFWNISNELRNQTVKIDFTLFSEYAAEYEQAQLTAQWETDDLDNISVYDRYYAYGAEDNAAIMFSSQSDITDIKVLSLEIDGTDDNGNINYTKSVVYTLDKLTTGDYFAVNMIFYGDIPNNGISYIDRKGIERCFAVEISGDDGSVVLSEIK